jgi:beta-mannosidase
LQYYARRFYDDLLISPHEDDGKINVYLVSDRQKPVTAQLRLTLIDFAGRKLSETNKDVEVESLRSRVYQSLIKADLLSSQDPKKVFLQCDLLVAGKLVSSSRHFFAPAKDLALTTPDITSLISPTKSGFLITLTTNEFARGVYLSLSQGNGFFSDNYFDMIPGRKVEVELRLRQPIKLNDLRRNLQIRSLVDAF